MKDLAETADPLRIEDSGRVRTLTMQHGAMNVLAYPLRAALWVALEDAEANPEVDVVLLMSGQKAFSAGADLAEMDMGLADAHPSPAQLVYDLLPAMRIPVVAVLSGMALGGGLELALSCHCRIATPDALIGLPEVTLGLLPGAGGTQLLPRAIGLERAANLILSGRPRKAAEFQDTALFDAMLGADPLADALAFARALPKAAPHLSQARVAHPNPTAFLQTIRTNLGGYPKRTPGHLPAVDCLEAAATLPFAKGRKVEAAQFRAARISPEGKALRYGFAAERAAGDVPAAKGATPRDIQSVAVIGAGAMGQGIAMACAHAGLSVRVLDQSAQALNSGLQRIAAQYQTLAKRGKLTSEAAKAKSDQISPAANYKDIADCDLVIEAVAERLEVKRAVFDALSRMMKPSAILASNTSTLDLNEIAEATDRPGDVIGLHFFNPAHVMRLLEVVRGNQTAPDVLATGLGFAKRLRKIAVVSGVCDGFIGNRMIEYYMRQALYMVEEGATPAQVDRALEQWGMAMGPFRMMDLVGNDVNDSIRAARRAKDPNIRLPEAPEILSARRWFGNKTGTGWYLHEGKGISENPDLAQALDTWRRDNGITPRAIGAAEIVDRCSLALVNEAAAILKEGIALRGTDVDTVYLTGFGFPGARGGPLYYADHLGLRMVRRKMQGFAALPHGDAQLWTPHPLIAQLANAGQRLTDYGKDQ